MRQPGEDHVSHVLVSTVRYTTRTGRADQKKVPRNELAHNTRQPTPKGVKPSTINILGTPVIPTTSLTFPDQKTITGRTCCYVHIIQIICSVIIQFTYRSHKKIFMFTRPVLCSASIPLAISSWKIALFVQLMSISHNSYPFTAVLIIYRSIFGRIQHLTCSSRRWC